MNSSKAEISILSSDTKTIYKAKTVKEKETIIKNLKETNTKIFNDLRQKIEENEKSHVREDVCLRKMVNFCWLMSLYRYFCSILGHGKPV